MEFSKEAFSNFQGTRLDNQRKESNQRSQAAIEAEKKAAAEASAKAKAKADAEAAADARARARSAAEREEKARQAEELDKKRARDEAIARNRAKEPGFFHRFESMHGRLIRSIKQALPGKPAKDLHEWVENIFENGEITSEEYEYFANEFNKSEKHNKDTKTIKALRRAFEDAQRELQK